MTDCEARQCGRPIRIFRPAPAPSAPAGSLQALKDAALGRSHRAKIGKAKLKRAIDLTREVLEVPADYRIGIVPASDTGAVEMALWSLLGAAAGRPCSPGNPSARAGSRDVVKELKLKDARVLKRRLRRNARPRARSIRLATWSSPGTAPPPACACRMRDWITADREGLTICDATSAAFAQELDWRQARCRDLLLAEGAGRRGRARHAGAVAARGGAARELQAGLAAAEDLPHDQGRQAQRGHLRGRDHQHAVDAVRRGLSRRAELGEVDRRPRAPDRRAPTPIPRCCADWVARTPWIDFLAKRSGDPLQHLGVPEGGRSRRHRADADAQAAFAKELASHAGEGGRRATTSAPIAMRPPGLRIWCGATVESRRRRGADAWLDWAFAETKAALAEGGVSSSCSRQRREPGGPGDPSNTDHRASTRSRLSRQIGAAAECIAPSKGQHPMTNPRVLISDALSPAAVQIFKDRGIEVDFQPDLGKDKDKLAEIIGKYDGLAIRSATKVTAKILERGDAAEGDRPRRHRRRQRRHPGRHRQGHHRDEHAVRQFDHHGRARHRPDAGAGARKFPQADASTQAGKWEKNRFMGVEITGKTLGVIGCGNIGSIVADRALGLQDEGDRLRSVPVAGARAANSASRRSSSTNCSRAPISSPCTRR